MPIVLPAADIEMLRQVQRGIDDRLKQHEIAELVGQRPGALQNRLARVGFEFVWDVRPIHGQQRLADLLEQGEIVAREERELAGVSA